VGRFRCWGADAEPVLLASLGVGLKLEQQQNEKNTMRSVFAALLLGVMFNTPAFAQGIYWQTVDQILSRKPAVESSDLRRYSFPRTDLRVTLDGVAIKPALALGGWMAFKQIETQVTVMGDLVLLEAEINPVMQKMIEGGLEITAVRNVLLRANPATFHLHIGGRGRIGEYGDAIDMATAIRLALVESNTPSKPRAAVTSPGAIDLNTAQLDQIMGVKGEADGGVYQFAIPRRDPITMDGIPVSPAAPMGVATGIGFQPTGNGKAAITGDFVVTADEVKPVIEALRAGGIEVTALHSHMLNEQPRLFFLHFWANDEAIQLANGLRAALSKMANAKS
jgi:hypothetical protein